MYKILHSFIGQVSWIWLFHFPHFPQVSGHSLQILCGFHVIYIGIGTILCRPKLLNIL